MNSFQLTKKSMIGIIILLVGLAYLLDAFNVIETREVFGTYWPVLLILFGVISLIDRSTSNLFGGILILIGVFFQLKELHIVFEHISLWNLFVAVLIIMVGLWFIFPKKKITSSNDSIHSTALFSGANINNISQNFKGGDVSAIFGGLDIDLRQCDLDISGPVVIDAFVAFGGIDLKVPDDWYIELKGLPIFGGWDNKKRIDKNSIRPEKTLTVKCLILFGGIDIK